MECGLGGEGLVDHAFTQGRVLFDLYQETHKIQFVSLLMTTQTAHQAWSSLADKVSAEVERHGSFGRGRTTRQTQTGGYTLVEATSGNTGKMDLPLHLHDEIVLCSLETRGFKMARALARNEGIFTCGQCLGGHVTGYRGTVLVDSTLCQCCCRQHE